MDNKNFPTCNLRLPFWSIAVCTYFYHFCSEKPNFCRSEGNGELIFEPGCIQPDPTNDLLEEMKSFSVTENSETTKQKSEYREGYSNMKYNNGRVYFRCRKEGGYSEAAGFLREIKGGA